jgi:hypothetical protein
VGRVTKLLQIFAWETIPAIRNATASPWETDEGEEGGKLETEMREGQSVHLNVHFSYERLRIIPVKGGSSRLAPVFFHFHQTN